MNIQTAEIIMKILLFIMLGCTFGFIAKYLYDFKVFQLLLAKIKGDVLEYDRVRRTQMKKELERKNTILKDETQEDKKSSFITKLYEKIRMTGIPARFPEFSELTFLLIVALLGILIFIGILIKASLPVAAVTLLLYFIAFWYVLDLIAYNRRMNVEGQLLQLTNACASASRQYSNIIDIIGSIYDQFTGALREALEACYVEAKTTNMKDMAFVHLKEKFNSVQFAFVIDNFDMCSSSTGDYYTVATDLAKTISIYTASHDRKAAKLRNAKLNISVMFGLCACILYFLTMFFDSGIAIIFKTTIGNILLVLLIGIFISGISIKAE